MNNYILSFITWLPAVGAILILALMKKDQSSLIKRFATAWFALDFLASLWLLKYNRGVGGMQFLEDHTWIPIIGARYQMGVDGVAVLLIVLTTLLGAIAALSSWDYIQKREKEYYVLLLLLQTAVIGVFASMDLFLFYLFFEVSLVQMYFLTQDTALTSKVTQSAINALAGSSEAGQMVWNTWQTALSNGTGTFNI